MSTPKNLIAAFVAIAAALPARPSSPTPFAVQCGGRAPLIVNADNDHYFKAGILRNFLPLEQRLSEEGARRYIDIIARSGRVTHLFACAIGQRASYDSKACDPIWLAVDEAKERGIKPNEWPVNAGRLHERGVDLFKVWCGYGRSKGISVWISQRMNDVHNVDKPWNIRTNRFWYEHPELRRSHGADKKHLTGFWTDEALNFAFPQVRDFAFGIFRELVDRYDADGFELDFMRFWQHLTPGREREEAPVLTAFIRRCRDYTNAKAKERGHPILLSSRVPSSYAAARAFGFDPEEWARQGLVDMIAIANFWAAADYDFDFARWKRILSAANPAVEVLPCVSDKLATDGTGVVPTDLAAVRGWVDNVRAEGAQGLYFFNAAYLADDVQREIYSGGAFAAPAMAGTAKRYIASYHDCVPEKMDNGRQLPIDLDKGGRIVVNVGSLDPTLPVTVVLGFDVEIPHPPEVVLNGCRPDAVRGISRPGRFGRARSARCFDMPPGALKRGDNVLVLKGIAAEGRTVWAEIGVGCDR